MILPFAVQWEPSNPQGGRLRTGHPPACHVIFSTRMRSSVDVSCAITVWKKVKSYSGASYRAAAENTGICWVYLELRRSIDRLTKFNLRHSFANAIYCDATTSQMIGSVDERFDQVASPREVGPRVLPIHLIEHLYVQHLYVQQVMNTVHKSRKFYQPIGCRIVWLNVLYEYENAKLNRQQCREIRKWSWPAQRSSSQRKSWQDEETSVVQQ